MGPALPVSRQELQKQLQVLAYLSGSGEPLGETLPPALSWLRLLWEGGSDHLPLTLVHDLGTLLLRGRDFRFASARDLSTWPDGERPGRLRYEDRVLGRWALDPSVLEAHITLAGMLPADREAAVAHAVGLALSSPLRTAPDPQGGNPAHLRVLLSIGDRPVPVPATFAGWADLRQPDEWEERVSETQQRLLLCGEALPSRLFSEADLWEIAHHPELPSESARLALREIHAACARIGKVPLQVAMEAGRQAREVPLDQDESDHYPAGGFDAISTRGSFENLVRTEVAYVGEGCAPGSGVDLFDLRFVESELLYYTRDESPLLDARRLCTLVIDHPAELRHKHPALPAQTLVLVQALCLLHQTDLCQVFGAAGAHLRLVWRAESDEDREVAQEERTLMALALRAEIAHRRVELHVVEQFLTPAGGTSREVVFSSRPADPERRQALWVRVGEQTWYVSGQPLPLGEEQTYPRLRALLDLLLLQQMR